MPMILKEVGEGKQYKELFFSANGVAIHTLMPYSGKERLRITP